MDITLILFILVILSALAFEYINGFHDAANAIATVVSTKVLTPRTAIIYGAILNFIGALSGTHVAKTIGKGLVDTESITQLVILSALIGAIVWNLLTWYFVIPSSSSHALIGGLLGSSVVHSGLGVIQGKALTTKVLIPMVASPIIGIIVGFLFMAILIHVTARKLIAKGIPDKINKRFRALQLISSGIMAFGHGSNDAQKTMGIIALALFSSNFIDSFEIPKWVIILCATTMALGTSAGGWKIIRTMGSKVIKLKPIHGFAAETSAAATILVASHFGIPVSTTHIISSSIMGVGSTVRASAVKWGLVGNIVTAWIITIPVCMVISALSYFVLAKVIG